MMKKIFAWGLLAGFAIVTLFWALSPYILRPVANSFLADYQLTLTESSSIRLNPYELSLEVKDLSLDHQGTSLLVFDSLLLDIEPSQLVFNQAVVKTFQLDGFKSNVTLQQEKLLVNGVDVQSLFLKAEQLKPEQLKPEQPKPVPANPATSAETEQDSDMESETSSLPAVLVSQFELTNAHLQLKQEQLTANLKLNEFSISDVVFDNGQLSLSSLLESQIELASSASSYPFTFNTSVNHQFKINAQLSEQLAANIHELTLLIKDTNAQAAGYDVSLDSIRLAGNQLQLSNLTSESGPSAEGQLSLAVSELAVAVSGQATQSVSLDALNLPKIAISPSGQAIPNIEIPSINLDRLKAMVNEAADPEKPLLDLVSLELQQLVLSPQGVSIDEIVLGKVDVAASLTADKQLTPLYLAQQPDAEKPATAESQPTTEADSPAEMEAPKDLDPQDDNKQEFAIKLNRFSNAQPIDVYFTDHSVSPVFSAHLFLDKLELTDLNSLDAEQVTKVNIAGGLKDYTGLQFSSQLKPFAQPASYSGKGKLTELSLPELSPYVSDALGYYIESGVLDTEFDFQVTGNDLQGTTLSHLKSVDLTALDAEGEAQSVSGGAISLNMALSMLKDSDGNVELDIPIEGDLNNPSVGLSGIVGLVVKQATMAAAKDYLITTFLPYAKVVRIAMSASDELLKMSFEPLLFDPEQTTVIEGQHEYLGQLAGVLKQKPESKIKLCGIAAAKEWPQLATDERRQQAKYRADAVKAYLVNTLKVASERIYSCAATIDTEEAAKPRVEIEQL